MGCESPLAVTTAEATRVSQADGGCHSGSAEEDQSFPRIVLPAQHGQALEGSAVALQSPEALGSTALGTGGSHQCDK